MRYFTKVHDFYKSKEWKQLKQILMNERLNENGELICEHCGKPILHTYDCIPHHFQIPLTLENVNDPNISLNKDNLMLVHFRCHNQLEHRFSSHEKNVYLIVGPPCSGKTTFVKETANGQEDLVLDFDEIWKSISINDKYVKPNRLKPVAFAMRECLMEQIKMRNGKWINAYIISTEPFIMNRKRLCDSLGVTETIFMDTTKEECLKRLHENPQGRDIELYEKVINDYYENFQSEELI